MQSSFLIYLTVFRSRLGLINIVLQNSSFVHQPREALARRILKVLELTCDLSLSEAGNDRVFRLLAEKSLIGENAHRQRGRYSKYTLKNEGNRWNATGVDDRQLSHLPVHQVDIWMADPEIPSTIGTPTAENVNEVADIALQLHVISKSKNTWTSAGHLISVLRSLAVSSRSAPANPFLLGMERVGLLRQIIDQDGVLIRELLRELVAMPNIITRDDVTLRFSNVVDRALDALKSTSKSPARFREAREFAERVGAANKNRKKVSSGPGVLEHRVAPRLEWLVDLGYLSKRGLPKNAFTYQLTEVARQLLSDLDRYYGSQDWASAIAVSQWSTHEDWQQLRTSMELNSDPSQALVKAFSLLKRSVGPSPIRDVAFLSALMCDTNPDYQRALDFILSTARSNPRYRLSGGRYSRSPENIFIQGV